MVSYDAHKNLAVSAVATAPSPATSGTSLVVAAGEGSRFSTDVPYNATVWPATELPDPDNAEVLRVTAISTDTLTITRTQEGSSARTISVGDLIAMTVTAKTLTDIEESVDDLLPWFTPEEFGAVGDGVADDTDAIQDAIDAAIAQGPTGRRGGTVRFADGKTYNHTGLVIGSGAEQYVSVNLIAASGQTTRLRYVGATNGIAVWIQGLLDYHWINLGIENGVAMGTTTGVLIDDVSGSGTQSGQGLWEGIKISGFERNIALGGSTSTSELTFVRCEFRDGLYGWVAETFNTLNVSLINCSCNGNETGYYIHQSGSIHWFGGSVGENTFSDFWFAGNSSGAYLIQGIRSETSDRFLYSSSGTAGAWIQVIGCDLQPSTNVDDILVEIRFGGHTTFQGCAIRGKVIADDQTPSFFDFSNTFVRGPQLVHALGGGGAEGINVVARNCQFRDVSEVTTDLSPLLVQIGQGDGTLLTLLETTRTGGFAVLGNTPVNGTLSTPALKMTTSPTAGYVLTADADGDASWQAAGAASVSFATHAKWE